MCTTFMRSCKQTSSHGYEASSCVMRRDGSRKALEHLLAQLLAVFHLSFLGWYHTHTMGVAWLTPDKRSGFIFFLLYHESSMPSIFSLLLECANFLIEAPVHVNHF